MTRVLDRAARVAAIGLGLDLTGQIDRAAEQQQLFGEHGFTGVRVRDDREGAAARHGVGDCLCHFMEPFSDWAGF